MSFGGPPSPRASKQSVTTAVGRWLREPTPIRPAARWKWLEALRSRLDLAIEVLDPELGFVLQSPAEGEGIVRAMIANDPVVRTAASASLKASDVRSLSSAGVRLQLRPLSLRSVVPAASIGMLVLGQSTLGAIAEADASPRDIDAVLDSTGRWLAAAIEAEVGAATDQSTAYHAADRLAGVIDVIDVLHQMTDEHEIVSMTMEALALWFDADVRVYQQEASGAFLLYACLPGVDRAAVPARLDGHQIWGRTDVFRFDSARELEALAWPGAPADTLFAPIAVEHNAEWVVTMSVAEPLGEAILSVLARVIGARLTDLHHDMIGRQRRELTSIFAYGDAPFDATARIALEAVARDTRAESASMTVHSEGESPAISVGWGTGALEHVPAVEAGSSVATRDTLSVGVRVGPGVSLVLTVRRPNGWPTGPSAPLVRAAATIFGTWISGALIRHGELRVSEPSDYEANFVGRLRGHLDRLGRLRVGGAVAVLVPDVSPPPGPLLDMVIKIVHDQVRSSDVVGLLDVGGAGVLLPDATPEVATAVVGRLLNAARTQGIPSARVGMATFAASSESPETLLNRAFISARRGTSLS